jgi:hypothetical protein
MSLEYPFRKDRKVSAVQPSVCSVVDMLADEYLLEYETLHSSWFVI